MGEVFFMKFLLPEGEGAFVVCRFAKNTEEGVADLRDALLAAGDWADASQEEYDNFASGVKAISGIIRNEEWARIESLDAEQKALIRGAVQGTVKLTAAVEPAVEAAEEAKDSDEAAEEVKAPEEGEATA